MKNKYDIQQQMTTTELQARDLKYQLGLKGLEVIKLGFKPTQAKLI